MSEHTPLRTVGAAVPRKDAQEKVTGSAVYTDDISLPGLLQGKVLRSPHAHARVVGFSTDKAEALPGVVAVVTRGDFEGMSPFYGYLIKDQPVLAVDKVRYIGDMVAAVAAEDEATAYKALELIEVEYETLPSMPDIESALADGAPELFEGDKPFGVANPYGTGASGSIYPQKNVCYDFNFEMGPADAFAGCDHVYEDSFNFSRLQHMHLEPFVSVARWTHDELEIWSATQSPFVVRKELARVFGHPENKIRINVPYIGGGYGAKNACKTEPLAAVLARKARRPVRLRFTAEECFLTNTQHASIHHLRTGVMSDGTLVARQSEIFLNSGAYADASPLVAEKAGYRINGSYRWQHIDTKCLCVLTTTAPAGAFRGFGGTQAAWASESQIDMIAHRLGIDPYDMRMKNLLNLHDPYVPKESGIDSDLREGLTLVADRLGYKTRRRQRGRGMGLSVVVKDGGGANKPAHAFVKATTTGGVIVSSGTVEIGQGSTTALTSIAAEVMNCERDRVSLAPVDTHSSPYDQGTFASSGVAIMGKAIEIAAEKVKREVLEFAAGDLDCDPGDLELLDWTIRKGNEVHPLPPMIMKHYGGPGFEFVGHGYYKLPEDHDAPLETQISYWENGWGGAEVEVDEETGQVRVLQLIVSSDFGRAINEGACRGQDEGGAMMALGQTLFETMVFDGDTLLTPSPLHYRVSLARDLPERFESILQEQGHGPGPFGTKGGGESGILPVASAVANAVEDAVGVRITDLPITPEKVLAALDRQKATGEG